MLKAVYNKINRRKNKELEWEWFKSKSKSDLKNEIKEMSDDETKMEKLYKIVSIVEKILEFNRQNQEGKRLKILTPDQVLSRLLISLAQLKAENNSEKLKNEIRQLLYSLYHSRKLTRAIYNNLINAI